MVDLLDFFNRYITAKAAHNLLWPMAPTKKKTKYKKLSSNNQQMV